MAWNYPLSFDPKEPFCIVYGLSCPRKGGVEIPSSFTKQGFALLCPYHDYYLDYCYKYYLKVFARDKVLLFTLFLLLLPFWRAKRRLIVNILTGAHLSLVSGNANMRLVLSIQSEAHLFEPRELQIGGQL